MRPCAALAVTQLDLDAPDGPLLGPAEPTTVLALVRLHRHPVGVVEVRVDTGHPFATRLRRAAVAQFGPAILEHELRDRGAEPMPWEAAAALDAAVPGGSPVPPGPAAAPVPPCLRQRARVLADPPPISVIIGTREQPRRLSRCLDSLTTTGYPNFEVLVIDSAPETDATRHVVERADGPIRYLRTHRPGRAAAHELGAAEAEGRLLAFTADDVRVDRDWLPAMAESFVDSPVGCAAGLTMPGEVAGPPHGVLNLAVDADLARDQLRGFDPKAVADLSQHAVYQPDAVLWDQRRGDLIALGARR
ncbi:glycosyltransferase [Actinospica robiniae]|uniref:glycosyltransferase n=1 Tax=Actinospica robiniae TaxID=304901 RepID=UPI0003F983E3|nr:glycosyltransferase family A protein [Actinospica robiniae]